MTGSENTARATGALKTAEVPAVNKGGARAGNRNRMTWGGRGWAAVGSYPKGYSAVRRYVGRMRAELESAVCERHGQIGVYEAALVQSACRHEGRALLLQRLLRVEHDSLSVTERLGIVREIGAASDSRDKCLKALGLDSGRQRDPWTTFQSDYLAAIQSEPSEP